MNLNQSYYKTLFAKYQNVKCLPNEFTDNSVRLTVKIILDHYHKKLPIHINFQNSKDSIYEIGRHLFKELANDIYCNHSDFPELIPGKTILRDKRKYADGKRKNYLIEEASNNSYVLYDKKNSLRAEISYDELIKKFIPITQGVQSKTILNYINFFKQLNNGFLHDFTPTKFEKKSVFISKRPLWDNLIEKNKIPAIYLPNPREESLLSESRTIPALSDCMIYFTPKYEVCYQNLLLKNEKLKTIIVFDTEADKIPQMLQDKIRFGFNTIVLSNSYSPVKNPLIPCWNWFKEELKIVNDL